MKHHTVDGLDPPRISDYSYVPIYTEDMPRASTFTPLRRNQTTKPLKVYLDRLVAEDIQFHYYVDHRESRSFDSIVLYSGWFACDSHQTFPHLPECIMRQFHYIQYISTNPFVFAPSAMTHRDMYVIFDDYLNHMVS